MKKYIFVINAIAVLNLLKSGKKLQGVLYYDKAQRALVFKANNPPKTKTNTTDVLGHTDFGRVTRNSRFVNIIQHYPISMGTRRMVNAIDRETEDVKDIVITNDLIERA